MKEILLIILATLVLGGCSTMNKGECLNASWRDVGYEDGQRGINRAQLSNHRKACAEHGITANSTQYYKGYDKGVRRYCTPYNGRRYGEQGMSYLNVCPQELEEAFLVQFDYGKELHEIIEKINQTNRDIKDKESLLETSPTADERRALRTELSALDRSLRALERSYAQVKAYPPQL